MEALTIHPKNKEQLAAIKSILKALKIPFDKKESHYNSDYVEKIREAEKHQEGAILLNGEKEICDYFKNLESDVQD